MKEARIDKEIKNINRKQLFKATIDSFEIAIDYFIVFIDILDRLTNLKGEYTKNKNNK